MENCQAAALRLSTNARPLTWKGLVTSNMPGCYTSNNNNVYFSADPNPRRNELPNTYSEICEGSYNYYIKRAKKNSDYNNNKPIHKLLLIFRYCRSK